MIVNYADSGMSLVRRNICTCSSPALSKLVGKHYKGQKFNKICRKLIKTNVTGLDHCQKYNL